jgi:iron complex transport system permease protein
VRPALTTEGRLTPRRLALVIAALLLALLLIATLSMAVGSERIPIRSIVSVFVYELIGRSADSSPERRAIILQIRLPRVLMAAVVGAALSVAGAAYQALLRNPLADPYILGVSTGAALGAILATIFAGSFPLTRPAAAFIGAVITMVVVYALGQGRRGASSQRLILAGVIVNTFLSSIVIFLLTVVSDLELRGIFSWLIGDLSGEGRMLLPAAALIFSSTAAIYVNARSLNLIMVGEQDAKALGVEVEKVKFIVYLAASLVTGAAVAISGVIGFVGLIVPHAVRMAGGSDNRLVVPASALAGATFLLISDAVARTVIAPRELHIGVITALVGAPAFMYLMRRAG